MNSSDGPSTEDLEDLFDNAPCGYVSICPDGQISKINRTLAEWLGRSPDDLVGGSLYDILGFGGRIAFETHLSPLLRMQGHVHEIALDLLGAHGEKIPTIGNAAEKRDPEGRHLFTRLAIFKAVDRRLYERTLLDARVAAEAQTKTEREGILLRDQFIAVLGHDIRNPLAALAAGIRMLMQREHLSERGSTILNEMKKSVDRAGALIDDVLDLARGRLGGGVFVVERNADAPLTPILEHVVAEVRSIAPTHAIEARIDIDEPVCCDRGRMGQLASNLLANAVTHGSSERPITFEAYTTGDQLLLTVANAGDAIPPVAMGRLFEPFFRGEARPSGKGLGLGLYIASEIAKGHGGTLKASSDAYETRFTCTIPLRGSGESDRSSS